MCADGGEVTLLLRAMKDGDESAAAKLFPLVYKELHRLASAYIKRERPGPIPSNPPPSSMRLICA